MSKAKGSSRVQPLPGFFAVAALSAAAAYFLQAEAGRKIVAYIGKDTVPRDIAGYAVVFAVAFLVLSFAHKHISVRFSTKAQGESAKGVAPYLARFFLAALVFAAPLAWMQQGGEKTHKSLQSLIAQGERKIEAKAAEAPQKKAGTGYERADRAKMDQLMEKMTDGGNE